MQILFLHGDGEGAYEADAKLVASLEHALAVEHSVVYPRMPDEAAPAYEAWKAVIAKETAAIEGEVIFVGHSPGGSVLLKYLTEEQIKVPVAGVFLIAVPYWGAEDWEVDEYRPGEDFASRIPEGLPVFFYHSHDDEVVPFAHLTMYREKLPQAIFREMDGRGHQFNNDLSEVAVDIANLRS